MSPLTRLLASFIALMMAMGIGRFALTPQMPHLLSEGQIDLTGAGLIVEAPEREVVAIPPGRVIGAVALSGTTVALVLAAAVIITLGITLDTPIIATSFIPILIGVAGSYWSALNTGYNFRAATSPDGIRMRYGLLDTR